MAAPEPVCDGALFRFPLVGLFSVGMAAAALGIALNFANIMALPLLLGVGVWPGVAIGAFVLNWTSGVPVLAAGAVALGNTLEAVPAATPEQPCRAISRDRNRMH